MLRYVVSSYLVDAGFVRPFLSLFRSTEDVYKGEQLSSFAAFFTSGSLVMFIVVRACALQ